MLQINPALAKIWLTPTTVQYGYPKGVQIENLTPQTERMLHFLEQGFLESQLPVLGRLAKCEALEVESLLAVLQPLLADWTSGLNDFSPSRLDFLQPEIHRLMRSGEVPAAVLESRSQLPIYISDFGKFGNLTLQLLIDLGFDYFITSDASLRNPARIDRPGEGSRLRTLKDALPRHCQIQLHSLLHESTARRVALAILVEFEVCNPLEVQFWQSFDVPTLRVRFSEAGCQLESCLPTGQPKRVSGSREIAAAEAQLARSPRRMESAPAVIEAAHMLVQEALRVLESNPKPREN